MTEHIIYALKSDLALYPPCLSHLRHLHEIGADVLAVLGPSDIATSKAIKIIDLLSLVITINLQEKTISWI